MTTTCDQCGTEYYEFPPTIEVATQGERLVYVCENRHTFYGPWSPEREEE